MGIGRGRVGLRRAWGRLWRVGLKVDCDGGLVVVFHVGLADHSPDRSRELTYAHPRRAVSNSPKDSDSSHLRTTDHLPRAAATPSPPSSGYAAPVPPH